MRSKIFSLASAGLLSAGFCVAGQAQLSNFFEDFEGLDRTDPNALVDFSVFAVSSDFNFFIPVAPNNIASPNISVISDTPSGGNPPDGNQGLVLLADFPSAVNQAGDVRNLDISIFGEQSIAAVDFGSTVTFDFLAQGNAVAPTGDATVEAFLQILNPEDNFALVTDDVLDLTSLAPGAQLNGSLSIMVPNDPFLLAGSDGDPNTGSAIVQFGFRNSSTNILDTNGDVIGENFAFIDADNLSLTVPEPASLALVGLGGLVLAGRRRQTA
ncbi:MAG: PEP-CTERM sorting domain-containing protein [Planctomycetota bacterium]